MHRFGGFLPSMSELPVHVLGDAYVVEGSGTVQSIAGWPRGTLLQLYLIGNATFVHSSKLVMPGSLNYTFSPGDSCFVMSLGDSRWRVISISRADGVPFIPGGMSLFPEPQGRLTLSTGVAETSADVTGASAATLYYTQSKGDLLAVYNASTAQWVLRKFTEPSLSLSGATANKPFDVFGYDTGSTIALESLVWTDDTTRATAITKQDGIDVKSGDPSRRLLGTFRTTGTTGQSEDSIAKRYLSNRYNDVPRPMKVVDGTATWASSGATWTQANVGNTANQLDFVCTVPRPVAARITAFAYHSVNSNPSNAMVGFGVNSVPAASQASTQYAASLNSGQGVGAGADYFGIAAAGRTYLTWIEYVSAGSGSTVRWQGTNLPFSLSGMVGTISG
ncbi:hypothetical protein [Bradyrhizobium sp. HKCCYLR1051]|uniref:hypothetical protein n=1 Tax=Bradyrhizobium sp. HKCCYLR1051 TaxID=3420738 RepID=UPI003EBE5A0B